MLFLTASEIMIVLSMTPPTNSLFCKFTRDEVY